ncbi:MAG: DsbC family protein [Pseudomonadales bacterium]|jgi:thiol:disulfide interchange protein DsbC|nr:DsbC family protein [Pseudomonadales bacterium]
MSHSAFRLPGTLLAIGLGCLALFAVAAEEVRLEGPHAKKILDRLEAARPGLPIVAVDPAGVGDLYAIEMSDGTVLYATEDGSHLVAGDLYRIGPDGLENRTEERRSDKRVAMLRALEEKDMIVFSPKGETRGVVNVFTDVDCGFCQRLHQEVPELNAMGIEVRYLAFPRAGIGSASYDKIVSAWCATDPRQALTRLKSGDPIEPRSCDNPVAAQYRLGQEMGVRGTPALFLEDGRMLPGYMPAAALAAEMGLSVGS